jgi:hypothetical protein
VFRALGSPTCSCSPVHQVRSHPTLTASLPAALLPGATYPSSELFSLEPLQWLSFRLQLGVTKATRQRSHWQRRPNTRKAASVLGRGQATPKPAALGPAVMGLVGTRLPDVYERSLIPVLEPGCQLLFNPLPLCGPRL